MDPKPETAPTDLRTTLEGELAALRRQAEVCAIKVLKARAVLETEQENAAFNDGKITQTLRVLELLPKVVPHCSPLGEEKK